MGEASAPSFGVVSGAAVDEILAGREPEVIDLIERAYLLHGSGRTTNPPSYFLRFPDKPTARIIALPASVRGDRRVDGIKWISSYPGNLRTGIPRASAALLLNDPDNGYVYACVESSIISATRTAASAAVAVRHLLPRRTSAVRVGFVGTGLIARYVHRYLVALGLPLAGAGLYDLDEGYARGFASHLAEAAPGTTVRVHPTAESLVRDSDVVVFATTAAVPHVHDARWFAHAPLVLHLSLRDLAPELVLAGTNVVDDVDHVLKADTSVHLAEKLSGGRDFVHATLDGVIAGDRPPVPGRPVYFSPFGLGVLDLVLGDFVHREAVASGRITTIPDFFHDMDRHRDPAGRPSPAGETAA
ncbi:2,3-diaminopropionate biosynthesis protein SbnB [Streptomyces sp. NPDC021224]|uniref:2,3-diaminopropionate biosynthesis protein SbnB n=1 Tax=unclassified Streptomyces TaxID=2593676 RepID=UPI0037939AD7